LADRSPGHTSCGTSIDWLKASTPGLDLFKVELDSVDYKAKLRLLNDEGGALMKQLNAALTF